MKDLIGITSRWILFGLQVLYAYWLNWYSSFTFVLLLREACRLYDDVKKTHVYLNIIMLTSSVYVISSLKKRVPNSNTTQASILANGIQLAMDDP